MTPQRRTFAALAGGSLLLVATAAQALDVEVQTTQREGGPLAGREVEVHVPEVLLKPDGDTKRVYAVDPKVFRGSKFVGSALRSLAIKEGLAPKQQEVLQNQLTQSGLSLLTAHLLDAPLPGSGQLLWNQMSYHLNEFNRSGTIDVTTKKEFKDQDGSIVEHEYRWIIAIQPGGLRVGKIASGHWIYFAQADQVRVIVFQVDGKDVPYFNDEGEPVKLAKVYAPHNDDCILIKAKFPPGDGDTPIGTPESMIFCAGSCSGYLLAATN
jgi:hypothetical protein